MIEKDSEHADKRMKLDVDSDKQINISKTEITKTEENKEQSNIILKLLNNKIINMMKLLIKLIIYTYYFEFEYNNAN